MHQSLILAITEWIVRFIKVLKTECCNFPSHYLSNCKKQQRYIKYNPKFYVKPARFLITLGILYLKETRGMEVWHVQTRPSTNIHLSFRYVGINIKPLEDPHYAWGTSQWNEMYNMIIKVSKFQNEFMKSYFGRKDDFTGSFWNLLTFSRQWRKKWRNCRLGT